MEGSAVSQNSKKQSTRLYFIDNLRVAAIMMVVAHHAAQPYGPTGGEWPLFNPERSALLDPFFPVNAAFFMGLLFMLAGYFVPASFDRKGGNLFFKERLLRLGIPLLFIGIVVFGPIIYATNYLPQGGQLSFGPYFFLEYIGRWQVEFAHMWFVAHLLAYVIAYSLWRLITRRQTYEPKTNTPLPGFKAILAFTLGLAVITTIVRFLYPIDRWERLLFVIPTEIAHLPQYLSLFIIGILAYRRDWFRRLSAKTGFVWLWIGLIAAVARYAYSFGGWRLLPSILETGGLDWRSLVWSTWESFICVGLCVGFLILFRERLNKRGRIMPALSSASYSVYIIHLFVVIGLQFGLVEVDLTPFIKFALVTLVGIPICFTISSLIIKLPFTKKIL
ncbi:acyltransferase family protein [Acidobacteriota bacterium]